MGLAGHGWVQMGMDEHERARISAGWHGLVRIGTDEYVPRNHLKSLRFKLQELRDGNDDTMPLECELIFRLASVQLIISLVQ